MIPLPVYKNHKTTSAKNGKESSPPLILCFTVFFQTLGEQNSERTFLLKHFGYFGISTVWDAELLSFSSSSYEIYLLNLVTQV